MIEITDRELDGLTAAVLAGRPYAGLKPEIGRALTREILAAVERGGDARALVRAFLDRGGMYHLG